MLISFCVSSNALQISPKAFLMLFISSSECSLPAAKMYLGHKPWRLDACIKVGTHKKVSYEIFTVCEILRETLGK